MPEFISPYQFVAPYFQPQLGPIAKGVEQGTHIAQLEAQMPYMKAHAKLAEQQAAEKEWATRRALEAYTQLYGGGALTPGGPMTPDKALLYHYAGLKSPETWIPKTHIEPRTGQSITTDPTAGTTQAVNIPGAVLPQTFHTGQQGTQNIPLLVSGRGDVTPVPGMQGGPKFRPEITPEEAGKREGARKKAELEVQSSPEAIKAEREKANARLMPFEEWKKREEVKAQKRIQAINHGASSGLVVTVTTDPETQEDVFTYTSKSKAEGMRAPTRGKPQNIYNSADPTDRRVIQPGEPIPDGFVVGNPPTKGKTRNLAGILGEPSGVVLPPANATTTVPIPIKRGKLTDKNIALDYLGKAGGDKKKAEELARKDGWEF